MRSPSLKADLPGGQISLRALAFRTFVQPGSKNFSLRYLVETALPIRFVPPQQEGRIAIVTRRGARDAMDVIAQQTNAQIADGEVVWS